MGLVEKIASLDFLGQEFATWLYWLSETGSGKVRLDGIEEFELWFEAPVQLVADYGEATAVSLRGGTPLESPEARQAWREGKKLDRARLRMNYENQTYTFGFNASSFAISGLKLPIPPNAPAADLLFLRLEILEKFDTFFQSLLDRFLRLRLDEKRWSAQRRTLCEWVQHEKQ